MSSPPASKKSRAAQREHRAHLDAMGQMASGIANELRGPVVSIASAAQLLRFRASEDPVLEKNVGRIVHEAERLNRMITALLEYGRAEPLNAHLANPDDTWDRVLEQHQGTLERRSVIVERVRNANEVRCAIDAEQLAVAFGHLLANAIEAAPEASDISLVSSSDGSSWTCRLYNGGDTIAREDLPHVFDMFFTTRVGNAGIGLATAQRIIEKHGGSIEIASVSGSGTTVVVTLPADS
jgi:two-component system, NtrC family, sensor histidine kinase HydH